MSKKQFSILFLATAAALHAQEDDLFQPQCVPQYIDSCACCAGPNTARITARHLEPGGIGFHKGYTSLDLFWAPNLCSNLYGFIDGRGHVFNDGNWAANLGLGLRYLPECFDLVAGVNVYGDWREAKHTNFFQIGTGFELLWACWDFRINGYIPVGRAKKSFQTGFDSFQGHEALTFKKWDAAFWGIDAGLGYWLYKTDCVGLHATIAGYYFEDDFNRHAGGGLLRAKMQFWDWVELRGQVSYDSLFKWKGSGELAINFSFGCPVTRYQRKTCSCCTLLNLEERLVEQPERFEIIVTKNKTKTAPALSPITGDPLEFFFVNNTSINGDGTFEHPFPTLLQAQLASGTTDVIYVFPGNGTDSGMDAGIILKDDQILTSSFLPFPIHSKFGDFVIPAMDTTRPTISNVAAVVTLANRNTVQGFNINGSTTGILASNPIESFTLISNIINIHSNTGSTFGVAFNNTFTGTFFAKDNTISATSLNATTSGIAFTGNVVNANVQLIENVISAKSSLSAATALSIEGPSFTGNLQLTGNTFEAESNQTAHGIFINSFQGTALVTGNEIKSTSANNPATGFRVSTGFNGNLNMQNNSIAATSPVGAVIGVDLNNFLGTFTLQRNTIASAAETGLADGVILNIFNGKFLSANNRILSSSLNQSAEGIKTLSFNGMFSSNSDMISAVSNSIGGGTNGIITELQFTGELTIQKGTISAAANTGNSFGVVLGGPFNGTFLSADTTISATSNTGIAAGVFSNSPFIGEFNTQRNVISAASPNDAVGIMFFPNTFAGDFIAKSNVISTQRNSGIFFSNFAGGSALIEDNTLTQTLDTSFNAILSITGSNVQATVLNNSITSAAMNNRAFLMHNTAGVSRLKLVGNILSSPPAFADDGRFENTAGTFLVESPNGFITGVEAINNNCRLTDDGNITYVP